jgi:hypothetical protein
VDDGEWTDMEGPTLWSLNLETGELSRGTHTLSVRASDGVSESDVRTLNFTAPGSGGTRLPRVVVIGPVLAIVIAIPVVVYLLRRRRSGVT